MKIKKMLLLAGTACLVALGLTALPSLTGAELVELHWYDDQFNKSPKTDDRKTVEPKGTLSITHAGNRFGPCQYNFVGTIWNEPGGMGEGEITGVEGKIENCPTSLGPTCTVLQSTVQELPMSLTLTSAPALQVGKMTIQLHLSAGCTGKPGITTLTPAASGSPSGQFLDKTATHKATVVFNNSGGLIMNGTGATLDGNLEFGTQMTAVPE